MSSWGKLVLTPEKNVFSTCQMSQRLVIGEPQACPERSWTPLFGSALSCSAHGAWAVLCLGLCKLGKAQRQKCLVPAASPPLSPLEWVIRLPRCQALRWCRAAQGYGPCG